MSAIGQVSVTRGVVRRGSTVVVRLARFSMSPASLLLTSPRIILYHTDNHAVPHCTKAVQNNIAERTARVALRCD